MPLSSINRVRIAATVCMCTLLSVSGVRAAMDPRFELDPQSLSVMNSSVKYQKVSGKKTPRTRSQRHSAASAKADIYTIKPGDHLFKILMRDYSLNNSEAESFIEEIKRENNIYDIKRLKIGQKITIPPVQRRSDGSLKLFQASQVDNSFRSAADVVSGQSFKLESPLPVLSEKEIVRKVQEVWNGIVPFKNEEAKPLAFQTSTFSLALDPERYPVFTRMDGGRIVLDQEGSIPPLVKALIEDKDPSIRIVADTPAATKHFVASMLEAAGFYSVEENFSMEFGVDPKLIVQTDFKVEKTAESLIKQDVVLVSSGRTSLPSSLGEFLKKEGFSLYEPFALLTPIVPRDVRAIHSISAKKLPEMIDSILSALSISSERDRRVDAFGSENNGITLSVKAERYFERGGQRFIVTSFDGDPVNYTLFRILEAKGYKTVILEAKDDFRKVSEKLISRMNIKGSFAQHGLVKDVNAGYSLQMSGFKLDDTTLPGGGIFLTDRSMDRIVKDLFTENGFTINSR